jgi:ATP-dependent RNA helicase DDX24/MAK5
MGFSSPTPIQSRALPLCLSGRDVVGVAETGSGKTLAYGLPILHRLLENAPASRSSSHRSVQALILAPTRELALQVSQHLNACLSAMGNPSTHVKVEEEATEIPEEGKALKRGKGKKASSITSKQQPQPKAPPLVSVAAIVGGMSPQKQKRILDRGVDVLVATPGRLWDILEEVRKPSSPFQSILS